MEPLGYEDFSLQHAGLFIVIFPLVVIPDRLLDTSSQLTYTALISFRAAKNCAPKAIEPPYGKSIIDNL
jgi:hypothetical protein